MTCIIRPQKIRLSLRNSSVALNNQKKFFFFNIFAKNFICIRLKNRFGFFLAVNLVYNLHCSKFILRMPQHNYNWEKYSLFLLVWTWTYMLDKYPWLLLNLNPNLVERSIHDYSGTWTLNLKAYLRISVLHPTFYTDYRVMNK